MNTSPYMQLSLRTLRRTPRYGGEERLKSQAGRKSGSVADFESEALGGLVQGSQQVTALQEMQGALQRDVDLAVVTGQLRQTGGLERRAQQTTGNAWKQEGKENVFKELFCAVCLALAKKETVTFWRKSEST